MAISRASSLGRLQHLDLAHHAVFQHSHVVEQVEGLEHHAHLGPVGGGVQLAGQDALPMEEDLAAGGGLQKVDAAKQGDFCRCRTRR